MRRLMERGPKSPAFVVSLLALFVALGGVGYAANGGRLILGSSNSASHGTTLRSGAGTTLTLTNTAGRLAAKFIVLSSKPPFAVNSRVTVRNLSADFLDGLDSSAFQRLVTGNCAPASAIEQINPNGTVACVSALSQTWNLAGNAGTTPATDFLGTTDAQPLIVKTNGNEALRVTASGDVGIGTSAPDARLDVEVTGDGEPALSAQSNLRAGVVGTSNASNGVAGISTSANGVGGQSETSNGVHGVSKSADGVRGDSTSGDGVLGVSSGASRVEGHSSLDGVLGISSQPANAATAAAVRAINTGGGDIFLGQAGNAHVARIDSTGKGFFDGGTQASGADYAEAVQTSVDPRSLAPGDVLAIDPRHGNEVMASSERESQLVVGVYSTRPSVLAVGNRGVDDSLAGTVPVAMLGVVPTKVSAENGPVNAGDLLTTSSTPGYAMKAAPTLIGSAAIYPTGAILGKALEPLHGDHGVIEVLVTLR